MCGRYTVKASTDQMEKAFDAFSKLPYYTIANYNAAPSQTLPVVLLWNNQKVIEELEGGFLPFWVKDKADFKRPINARCESILEKKMFSRTFVHRRCLIPASGFYEWDANTKPKQPFYFHLPDRPIFAFAGIWDLWKGEGSINTLSFAIITKEANDTIKNIHSRMPIIVSEKDYDAWLYKGGTGIFDEYVPRLDSHMVDRAVNKPEFNEERLIKAI